MEAEQTRIATAPDPTLMDVQTAVQMVREALATVQASALKAHVN